MIEIITSIIFFTVGLIFLFGVIKKNIIDKELLYPWTSIGLPNYNTNVWRLIESIIFGGIGIIALTISVAIFFN